MTEPWGCWATSAQSVAPERPVSVLESPLAQPTLRLRDLLPLHSLPQPQVPVSGSDWWAGPVPPPATPVPLHTHSPLAPHFCRGVCVLEDPLYLYLLTVSTVIYAALALQLGCF